MAKVEIIESREPATVMIAGSQPGLKLFAFGGPPSPGGWRNLVSAYNLGNRNAVTILRILRILTSVASGNVTFCLFPIVDEFHNANTVAILVLVGVSFHDVVKDCHLFL